MTSISIMSYRERIIRDELINGNSSSRYEFSKLDDHELSLKKMYEKAGSIIKQGEKLLVKINSKRQIARKNSKFLPNNATIRKEYVKCGKESCLGCEHGPYYYAYWRNESRKKLKKKYIGRHDPRDRNTGNYSKDLEISF